MDFERAVCCAYFYDYPLSTAVDAIKECWNIKKYLNPIELLLNYRMPAFTLGEVRQLTRKELEYWNTHNGEPTMAMPLRRLAEVCESMLCVNTKDNNPQVNFDYHLKWRELTLLLGEEIPVCLFLAYRDKATGKRTDFLWKDTLVTNNGEINDFLRSKHKSDIHVHMDASSNAFDVGWVRRMNWRPWTSPQGYSKKDLEEKSKKETEGSMELELNFWFQNHYGNYYTDWVNVAAIIRYWMFQIVVESKCPTPADRNDILESIDNKMSSLHIQNKIFFKIKGLLSLAPCALNESKIHWDYAIGRHRTDETCMQSPYMLLWGERKLIYSYMWLLLQSGNNGAKIFVPYFYLYLLIKTHCRKELVMTNGEIGLANYQEYQKRLPVLSKDVADLRHRYAFQTSCGLSGLDYVEARISFDHTSNLPKLYGADYLSQPIMGKTLPLQNNEIRAGMVLSWSKPDYKSTYALVEEKKLLKKQFDIFYECLYAKDHTGKNLPYVGIDIAGSDTKSRPYDFAHIIRYAKAKNFENFTYHLAEDFFDLVDGLRAVDELLYHLDWNGKNRIGHALSLFTDAKKYYQNRHLKIVMPVQMMLDNYAWLLKWADTLKISLPANERASIEKRMTELYNRFRIGNNVRKLPAWNLRDYQQCMLLRGDDAIVPKVGMGSPDVYENTRYSTKQRVKQAWANPNSVMIHRYYKTEQSARTIGMKIETDSLPKCDEFIELIEKIQLRLRKRLQSRAIKVESCPTSNYHIGNFEKYEDLPIVKCLMVDDEKDRIKASINTDARAIFDTSLDNEYALMAIALHKKGIPFANIKKILGISIRNSNNGIFR